MNSLPQQNNIVKISFDTDVKKAINYVNWLLLIKNYESVILCGLNQAINKVILITEVVKSQIKNIHQINNIDCLITRDKFDPSKEKMIPKIEILLSLVEPQNKGNGYQKPMSEIDFLKIKSLKNLREDYEKECNDESDNIEEFSYCYENKNINNEKINNQKNKNKKYKKQKKQKKLTLGYMRKGPIFRLRRRLTLQK
jgi:hypothetical protein